MQTINIQEQTSTTSLIDTLDPQYESFLITFKGHDGQKISAHSFIIFPKCPSLELIKESNTVYIVRYEIFSTFENFIRLLYGKTLSLDYPELIRIYHLAMSYNYSELFKIKEYIYKSVDKLSYSSENNQMYILVELMNNDDFDLDKIIKIATMSQLKRIVMMTSNDKILRNISLDIMRRYTETLTSLKKHHEKEKSDLIAKNANNIVNENKSNEGNEMGVFKNYLNITKYY